MAEGGQDPEEVLELHAVARGLTSLNQIPNLPYFVNLRALDVNSNELCDFEVTN